MHPSKRKGSGFEREVVHRLEACGIKSHRIPLSGAMANYKGDLRVRVGGLELTAECKRRRRAYKTLVDHLSVNNMLFVRDDHGPTLVVMELGEFSAIVQELNMYVQGLEWRDWPASQNDEKEGWGWAD